MLEQEVRVGATDLDAERNKLMGAGVVSDPYPTFARLTAESDVHAGSVVDHFPGMVAMNAGEGPQFTVYGFDACTEVLRDSGTYSSTWYEGSLNAIIGPTMIGMDDPEHRRMRALLQPAFSRGQMARWMPRYVQPVVDEHLRRIAPLGRCDIYHEIGSQVPIHTISAALGLPVADRARFFDWALQMTSGTLDPRQRIRAGDELADYITPLVAERRADDGAADDLLTVLVRARVDEEVVDGAEVDDRPLSDEEIARFVRLLVIAGAGTTYRAYGNLMYALLTHRDQLELVRADRTLVPRAVEESLRLEQPIANWGRTALREAALDGHTVPAGCPVTVNVGAANHDPRQFPDPERFDVTRGNSARHLTFGFGLHRCLGIYLARAELETMLTGTLDLFPDLRLDPEATGVEMTGLHFRMPTHLPVVYTPVAS